MENKFNHELIQRLCGKLSEGIDKERILADEPMNKHTTFRVGGVADIFVEISSVNELKHALEVLQSEKLHTPNRDYYLIGNGSNLLVSDKGLRGVVLHISKSFGNITVRDNMLMCEAGAQLSAVARVAYENSLTGFEFAAGIPGSLGGALVMNAGAYDGEMKNVVEKVTLMSYFGEIIEKSADDMHFSYRHSILKEENFIALGAAIRLQKGNAADIKQRMEELSALRRSKQPLEYPSAGSAFKRPEGYFAAKLIQDAGLKGFCIGGAQVSEKHCGFVINKNNATALDIYMLIKKVQEKVKENSGVTIEPEVICLGEFL